MTNNSSPDLSSATSLQQQQPPQKMRELIILPKEFEPTEMDVVIGRGKKARTHEGNNRLRGLIEFMIPEYSSAGSNKDEKSYIIKEIVTQIRKSSPDGGFVKFDKSQNRWCEVGDFLAREKISQTFRDAMGDAYSSSNPYKRKRRSFEKKHNAIVDIIKRRRGDSPTSVVQSGASSPPSPPSPEPTTSPVHAASVAPLSVTPSPPMSPPRQSQLHNNQTANPALMDMFKRPGQIGFARRSMLQFGMTGRHVAAAGHGPAAGMYGHANPAMATHNVMRPPVLSSAGLRRPVPHFAGGLSTPPHSLQQQHQHHLNTVMSMPSRRASMPGAAYSPALMADMMMNRQRMARNAALIRRPSAPQGM